MTELSSQSTSIQTIYGWYRDGKLIVNRRYQRKLVWTMVERQKLVDSVLNKYPIPLILLAESNTDGELQYEIIDGLQRLNAILSFIENGFSTQDEKFFNIDEFPRAKAEHDEGKFSEEADADKLDRRMITTFLDYSMPISIIQRADQETITEVFGRINTYGHRLSDQEQRQAGQISTISKFVRNLSCDIRGDVSVDKLPLHQMPEISIDLPKSKSGYNVQATDVYWVKQGILRSTDLRDSMDEQLLADLAICCVSEEIIERSKIALDDAFDPKSDDGRRIEAALVAYDTERISEELKYCLEQIEAIVDASDEPSLSRIVFEKPQNNSFSTVFVTICVAIHELIFKENLIIANHKGAAQSLNNVSKQLDKQRNAAGRRLNINTVKGRLRDAFVGGDIAKIVFGSNREIDIRNTLRRSKIEVSHFELKQGILSLDDKRKENTGVFIKVIQTICAIANNNCEHDGMIFIGVADNLAHAKKVKSLDQEEITEIDGRFIVGIKREAIVLGISLENYFQKWRDQISNSGLSPELRTSVLSKMSFASLCGREVLAIPVPKQSSLSFLDGKLFYRDGDQTKEADAETTLALSKKFD